MDSHLAPEQIVAYRDGELRDPKAAEHLRTCETCRAGLAEARRTARSIPTGTAADRHPGGTELTAYLDEALSPRDASQIERHARGCERCAALLLSLERRLKPLMVPQPPQHLVAMAGRQMARPHPPRRLGRVLVWAFRQRALGFSYQPEPSPMMLSSPSVAYDSWEPEPGEFLRVASYLRRDRLREPSMAIPESSAASAAPPTGPLEIEAGRVLVTLDGKLRPPGALLRISAHDRKSRKPAVGLKVTVLVPHGQSLSAYLDDKGRAELELPPGELQLLIHTEPAGELTLDLRSLSM